MALNLRSFILSVLARWYDLDYKQMGAAARMDPKGVSKALRNETMEDRMFERLRPTVRTRPAHIPLLTACHEGLQGLEQPSDLSEDEQADIEEAVLVASRLIRQGLGEALRLSRPIPTTGYPQAALLALTRRRAGELLERLKGLESEGERLAVVQVAEEYQLWALCELACEESVRQAARDLESAAAWARLAREIAERVRGTKGWRNRLLGYAMAHEANILRVAGELNEADVLLREAKHLWLAGSDPDRVLDPGRLLDLEAGLRREQRQFNEALRLLAQAESVSHFPYRARLLRAFTFEAMGNYERAIEVLIGAIPQIDLQAKPREKYIARFNLAVNQTHVGRYREASELVEVVRQLVTAEGDKINLVRVKWLEGRIAAGLGRRQEAQTLLEEARRDLAGWKIFFDAALALLEEMVLFLEEGRTAEVTALAPEVAKILEAKGVHREALVALRLFHEAVERKEATAELGRRVLRYLFRARYDQDLPFDAS